MDNVNLSAPLQTMGKKARTASYQLSQSSTDQKNKALLAIADALIADQNAILKANQLDLENAKKKNMTAAFLDRLTLSEKQITAMSKAVIEIAKLPDPVGSEIASWVQPNGLEIHRIRVPIGVIAVIYESRPNVTIDAAALCLKSGNAVILRPGSESFFSAQAILQSIHRGLKQANMPVECVQMIPTPERSAVDELLMMDQYVDVIIPRGGKSLIEHITAKTKIPLFKHLEGICHTYLHDPLDPEMAKEIVLNAKMRRTGICGATETLLVDRSLLTIMPEIIKLLIDAGCEVRGDQEIMKIDPRVVKANEEDWDTEYLDAIIAIKTVSNADEAIAHINDHGSQHTDAIITRDNATAERFLREVNSAIAMHNTSTQFADGGEFGMGAEIGISTGRLHARGPVGVEQLTTMKYLVKGAGQLRPK